MSIWGKLVGAGAGLAIGGPMGALLGAVAGHYAIDYTTPEHDRVVFTISLIALCAKMAKVDGTVSHDEVRAFHDVLRVPPEQEKRVEQFWHLAQQDIAGYEAYAHQIARLYKDKPGILEDVLDGLFHVALADDGTLDAHELAFLARVAEIFGFPEGEFHRIRASHSGVAGENPYLVLGLEPGADLEAVRTAWRQLARENHPDRLIARGVPEELVHVATEKLAGINSAYEQIVKYGKSGVRAPQGRSGRRAG